MPFVINKEQRSEYMKLLADCDVDRMADMFYKLMESEKNRMKEFQIDTSKFILTPPEIGKINNKKEDSSGK